MARDARIDYSIVLPVYFNEGLLAGSLAALKAEVIDRNPQLTAEVIFVDDGSQDGSFDELMRIRAENPGLVRVIKLTRNFGQVPALLCGFAHARGRCIVAMSADGQDPAALINDMLRAHLEEGYPIVAARREGRDESFYRILTSKIFYWTMRKLSFPNMPIGGFDFVLLGRDVVRSLLRNRDAHPFFQGQILWTGYSIKFLPYRRKERESGESRWTFGRKLTYLIDGVLGYSFFPIRFISVTGFVVATLGVLYAISIFALRLLGGIPVEGWAPLMIVILVMGGFQMVMLGVIGEYLWRALAQSRNRDLYLVERVYENPAESPVTAAASAAEPKRD